MANKYQIVTPYSQGYVSEREFFINIQVGGEDLPKEELQQLRSLELDLDEGKATVGKLVIGTTASPDSIFGRRVSNHQFWNAGKSLVLFLGPRADVQRFGGLTLKEPKYQFTEKGVVVTVKFSDKRDRMSVRKRQRRFKNMSATALINKVATKYGMVPKIEVMGEDQETIFDDNFSFSQVNQTDAEMMDTLCRKFNWRWRVNGDLMELYKDMDNDLPVVYQLDFRTGECSIDKFVPVVKRVDIAQHVPKITRPKFTAGKDAGKGKATPITQLQKQANANTRLLLARRGKLQGTPGKVSGTGLSQPRTYAPAPGSADALVENTLQNMVEKMETIKNNPGLGDAVFGPKMKGRQKKTWIHAEAVLAFPTMRVQPKTRVNVACGGSEFFTRTYHCKKMKVRVDGKSGGVAVNLFLRVLAWSRNYPVVLKKKKDDKIAAVYLTLKQKAQEKAVLNRLQKRSDNKNMSVKDLFADPDDGAGTGKTFSGASLHNNPTGRSVAG